MLNRFKCSINNECDTVGCFIFSCEKVVEFLSRKKAMQLTQRNDQTLDVIHHNIQIVLSLGKLAPEILGKEETKTGTKERKDG